MCAVEGSGSCCCGCSCGSTGRSAYDDINLSEYEYDENGVLLSVLPVWYPRQQSSISRDY